jgi:glycosyltransferase involved in cell wall biosynthesis
MHVVFIDTTLTSPPLGGAATCLVELCLSLATGGYRVTVVTQPGRDESAVRRLATGGVEVRPDLWRSIHLPEERADRLASWINRERADVVVISVSADAGWLALPLLDASIATMSIAHADGPAFYDPLRYYAAFIDRAVGVSASIRKTIVEECSVPPERAQHIPYGVPLLSRDGLMKRLSEAPKPQLQIAYLGRLVQGHKRVLDLLPLSLELTRRAIPFSLHVIGDGPERPTLERGFRTNGVKDVKFWGRLAPEAVREALQQIDVLLLLSDSEGLPLALLEAMGHGVAPIVTNLEGGLTEVVQDGHNGFLVEVGDIKAFADRIQTLSGDRKMLTSMSRAAWEVSQDYSVEQMVRTYIAAFQEISNLRQSSERNLARHYPVMPSCRSRYPFWIRKMKYSLYRFKRV